MRINLRSKTRDESLFHPPQLSQLLTASLNKVVTDNSLSKRKLKTVHSIILIHIKIQTISVE